ncbi:MAG: hypothetical protein QOH56_4353 [Pseudonocardiales bacterium]|nr:hypothetical protein [Pseudonocardiales bacterium]
MSELDEWWVHTVAVETKLGAGAYGDQWASAVPALVFVEDVTKLVRDASGTEVVSTSTVFGELTLASLFALGSMVTTSSGRESRVITLARFDSGSLEGLDHIEVHLS